MDLLTLYKAILQSLSFKITPEGLLTYCVDGSEFPAVIDNKRLALPTREILRQADWDNIIGFHPMSESVMSKGESIVLKKLKEVINHRLRTVVSDMLMQMTQLGLDTPRQASIPPGSSTILSAMTGIDEKFEDALTRMLSQKNARSANNHVISIYLKNRGNFRGRTVASVATVFFPLLEQIEDENEMIAGVKLRVKDRVILKKMFDYLFPNAADKDAYSAPTTGQSAPNFDALMRAYVNVATRINEVVDKCGKVFSNPDELRSDLSWFDAFQDLSVYDGQIPVLSGNEGERIQITTAPEVKPELTTVNAIAAPKADDPPWKEEEKVNNSPFQTENISQMLRATNGPFRAASGAQSQAQDPNRLDRNPSGRRDEDYAAWLARHNKTAPQPQPQPYGYPPPQGTYPQPTAYGYQQQGPAWLPAGPVLPAPGEYAGRVRGTALQPAYGMAYGYPQQQPYGVPQPGGYYPNNGGAL
jgi:hypothetical protein